MSFSEFRRFLLPVSFVLVVTCALPAWAQNAIDFSLKDLEGKTVRLAEQLGEDIILLNFWATWCTPCTKELLHFQKLHEAYTGEGLQIFTISVDGPQSSSQVKPFMQRYQYTFRVLLDVNSQVVALYNPQVILPYSLLIDRQGRIRHVQQGYSPGDEKLLEERILQLLAEESTAPEKKISFTANEAFLYRNFSDDNYVEEVREGRASQLINQFDLTLAAGDFLAGIRLDADIDFSPWRDNYSLAKRYVAWNKSGWSLWAGDYYYQLGRGLTFSMLKVFEQEGLEFILDTTVDGGKVTFGRGAFSADVFGGWIDHFDSDLKDVVYGGTLGWNQQNLGELRVNFLGSELEKGSARGNKAATLESFSLNLPNIAGKAQFYGEFALIQKTRYFSEDSINGHGIYFDSSLALGNFTFLIEFKDYLHLDFEYNRPPLIESEELPILANQFIKDARDVTGITSRLDYYSPSISTLFFSKLAFFKEKPNTFPRDVVHVYGGVEKNFKETGWIKLIAGYRNEDTTSLAYYYTSGSTPHIQINLSYPITERFSLEGDFEAKNFKGNWVSYYERRSFLSVHHASRWILTLLFDQTSDPLVRAVKDKRDWLGLQLEIKFTPANSVRIFYGSDKGGVKCSGGICKFFPPFEGLRLEGIFRF